MNTNEINSSHHKLNNKNLHKKHIPKDSFQVGFELNGQVWNIKLRTLLGNKRFMTSSDDLRHLFTSRNLGVKTFISSLASS